MKKILIVVVSIFAVGLGYFFYTLNSSTDKTIWDAIPDDAVAVIELSKVDEWWYDHEESTSLEPLKNAAFVQPLKKALSQSAKILKKEGYTIFDLTGDKQIALLLSKSKKGITASLLIPVSENDDSFLKVLLKGLKSDFGKPGVEIKKAETGFEYYKLKKEKDEFYIHKSSGLLCVSFTNEGMSSILGALASNQKESEFVKKKKLHEATEVTTENLNVYLNPVMLFQAINPLMKDASKSFLHALEHFADNAFLDIKFDEGAVYFNGFTHDSDTAFTFANCLKTQKPIPFSLKSMLPNRTLSFAYLGISDGVLFKHNLEEYSWSSDKPLQDGWSVLHKTFQINVDDVYKEIRGEVVLVEVLNRFKTIDKLIYIKPVSIEKARGQYNEMALGVLDQDKDLVREQYKDVEITQMGEFDFPGKVFGSYFSGFESTYYAAIGDYIVLSESPQPLKALVNDMEEDEVWSRSLEKNFLVERYFTDANFGFYVDLNQAITWLNSNLSPKGQASLKGMDDLLSQVGMFSIQITNENEKLFTSMISVFEGSDKRETVEVVTPETLEDASVLNELYFEHSLVSKPIIVNNHVDHSLETLVVDSTNTIHLVSSRGELLWSYQLEGEVVSKIHQVDVFKNQKLQYLLATSAKVYCIDRKGNDVDNYPYALEQGSGVIKTLSVVDYEGVKDYRVGISSTDGYLVLNNIEGKSLEGWNPKKFESPLLQPLLHSRVRGKDFMLTAEKNKIHAFKRNGEYYEGFPVSLKGEMNGSWFVKEGPSLRKSIISFVLDNNRVKVVAFNGKEELKNDFRNITATPNASLVSSAGNEKEVFLINESSNVWSVFDNDKQLFTVELEDYSDLKLQYYPIKNRDLFVLISKERNQVMIYNKKGQLVGGEVLDGSNEISLLYLSAKDVYKVYINNRKSLRVIELKAN